jgi:hypothetical protein
MYPGAAGEVTGLLQQMRGGDSDAVDRLKIKRVSLVEIR